MNIDLSYLVDTMKHLIETPSPVGYYDAIKPVIEAYAAELSYTVTYELGIPHGRAVGMFLGGYVDSYGDAVEATGAVNLLGFATTGDFRKYMRALLGETEIPQELLRTAAKMILADPGKLKNCPFPMTEEKLLGMLN